MVLYLVLVKVLLHLKLKLTAVKYKLLVKLMAVYKLLSLVFQVALACVG